MNSAEKRFISVKSKKTKINPRQMSEKWWNAVYFQCFVRRVSRKICLFFFQILISKNFKPRSKDFISYTDRFPGKKTLQLRLAWTCDVGAFVTLFGNVSVARVYFIHVSFFGTLQLKNISSEWHVQLVVLLWRIWTGHEIKLSKWIGLTKNSRTIFTIFLKTPQH